MNDNYDDMIRGRDNERVINDFYDDLTDKFDKLRMNCD